MDKSYLLNNSELLKEAVILITSDKSLPTTLIPSNFSSGFYALHESTKSVIQRILTCLKDSQWDILRNLKAELKEKCANRHFNECENAQELFELHLNKILYSNINALLIQGENGISYDDKVAIVDSMKIVLSSLKKFSPSNCMLFYHYILVILYSPKAVDQHKDWSRLKRFATATIYEIPAHILQSIRSIVKNLSKTEAFQKLFFDFDNCYSIDDTQADENSPNVCTPEECEFHVDEIINKIFNGNSIYCCDAIIGLSETSFDGIIFIKNSLVNEIFEQIENIKEGINEEITINKCFNEIGMLLVKSIITIQQEMLNVKRFRFDGKTDFFNSTPKKYSELLNENSEIGEYYEEKVGACYVTSFEKAEIFIDQKNWVIVEDKFLMKELMMRDEATAPNLSKKARKYFTPIKTCGTNNWKKGMDMDEFNAFRKKLEFLSEDE